MEWSRHLGEETELDFGRWICNTNLPDSDEANCLLDAYLIPGTSPSQLLAEMNDRCQKAGTPWRRCSINPSAPIEQTAPLIEALQTAGWKPTPTEILYKKKGDGDLFPPRDQNKGDGDLFSLPNLTVIPSRASYRHYRELMDKREAGSADIALMHLDDSHVDSLLALRGGEPVGCINILTTGEVGTVREWFVASNHRREGIGCQLLDRALEICASGPAAACHDWCSECNRSAPKTVRCPGIRFHRDVGGIFQTIE